MSVGRLRIGFPLVVKLGLAVATVMVVWTWGLLPVRNWVDQRDEIRHLESELYEIQSSNDRLAAEIAILGTDAEIERLARRDFGLVYPGEEAYSILPSPNVGGGG